jgi:purine-binding chemotaxis protein CheW
MSITSITDIRQYLTFQLGEEVFAVDVSHVREILEFSSVTKVPKTPEHMRGVINLRDSVVPVLDMRLKNSYIFNHGRIKTHVLAPISAALVLGEVFSLSPELFQPALP